MTTANGTASVNGLDQLEEICNSDPKDPDKATFPTKAEAAANAMKWAAKQRGTARESGGLIYRTADGRFRATVAPVGTETNVVIPYPTPIPSNLSGAYHIHPPGSGGDNLSTALNAPLDSADTLSLKRLDEALFEQTGQRLTAFLGTPNGAMKKFTGPFSGFIAPDGEIVLPEGCLYYRGRNR